MWTDSKQFRDRSGTDSMQSRDRCGTYMGMAPSIYMTVSECVWDKFRTDTGQNGSDLEQVWGRYGTDSEQIMDGLGTNMGQDWNIYRTASGQIRHGYGYPSLSISSDYH